MNPVVKSILQQPFVQVALPIVVALTLAAWLQNKRFDDMNRRLDEFRADLNQFRNEVNHWLERIETKLDRHNDRITWLEERTVLVR
jgi:hypothetical protein